MSTTNTTDDLFIRASRIKLRFPTNRGELSAEDLWDLNLEQLDAHWAAASDQLEKQGRRSLITETRETKAQKEMALRVQILEVIVNTKLAERDAAKTRAANQAKRAELLRQLDDREQKKMEGLSEEDIRAQLATLPTE